MATSSSKLVTQMASKTGVDPKDVSKVLDALGLSRVYSNAVKKNDGKEPTLNSMKVAFRLGQSTVIM